MVEALDALPLPPLSFQFNNRKLIQGFYRGLGLPTSPPRDRTIDKLDKLPAQTVADLLVGDAGATPEQARPLPGASRHRVPGHLVRRPGPRARGAGRPAGRGARRARRRGRGLRRRRPPHVSGRGNLRHRPRSGLLHRHGRRDLHGRLRAPQVRRRRRSLRRARLGRQDDLPGRRRLLRRLAHPRTAASADGVLAGEPVRPVRRPRRAHRRGHPAAPPTRSPRRCARRGIPTEVAVAAQKFGKQIRYAERRGIPYVWFPGADGAPTRSRTSAAVTRSTPTRSTWTPPAEDLRPRVVSTCPPDRQHPHQQGATQ